MAEPIVRKFVIDTAESEQNLKELNTQINATSNSVEQGAQSLNQVAAAENNVAASSKSLKAQLRELQAQLAATDPNSEKYRELAAAAGELKDQIQDAAQAVGTQAGGAFERVSGSLGLVTSRIASLDFTGAAEGAKLLAQNIGQVKFDDIANGLKGLANGFLSIGKSLLQNPIFLIGGAIAAIVIYWEELDNAIKSLNPELQRTTALSKSLNDEINKQSESVGKQVSQINALFNAVQDQTKADEERKAALEAIQTLYPDVFANQNVDINNTDALTSAKLTLVKAIEAEAKANAAKVLIEQQYAKQFELQLKIQEQQLKVTNAQIDADKARTFTKSEFESGQEFAAQGIAAQSALESAKSELNDLQQELSNNAKNIADIEKVVGDTIVTQAIKTADAKVKGNDKVNQSNQKTTDKANELNDLRIKNEQEVTEAIAQSKEEQYQASLDAEGKELREVELKYQELRKKAGDNAVLLKQLREQEAAEQTTISNKYFDERIANDIANEQKLNEAKLAADKAYYDALAKLQDEEYADTLSAQEQEELAVMQKYDALYLLAGDNAARQKEITDQQEAELNVIREKYRKEDEANQKASEEKKRQEQLATVQSGLEWTEKGLNATQALTDAVFANRMSKVKKGSKAEEELAKKQFSFNKKLQLGGAIIDAAKAVTASLSQAPVAIGPLPNPAGIASLALATATGVANIAKIASTKFEGGSAGGSDTPTPSIPGGGGPSEPAQFNPLAASFLDQRQEQITPRAYVLASDVASAAEVRENVADLARIG